MPIATGKLKILPVLLCLLPLGACTEPRQTQSAIELNLNAPMELAFWQSVVNSQDPAAYEAYLETYPTGHFSALAQLHLQSLRTGDQRSAVAVAGPGDDAILQEASPAPAGDKPMGMKLRPVDEVHAARKSSHVRQGPGTSYSIIGHLAKGEEVIVIGQVEGQDWYQVALAQGTVGFIYGPLLNLEPGLQNASPAGTQTGSVLVDAVKREEERLAWEGLRDSNDWLDYQRYIWIYGDHALFAPEARWRRDRLKKGVEPRLAAAPAGLTQSGQKAEDSIAATADPAVPSKRFDGRWTGVALTRFGTQCKASYDINMIVAEREIHGAMLRSTERLWIIGRIDEGGEIASLEASSNLRVDFLVLSATTQEISGRWSMGARHDFGGSPCTGSFNIFPA